MIVTTTPYLSGQRIVETKGQVFGLVVRSRGLGGNIAAGGDPAAMTAGLMMFL